MPSFERNLRDYYHHRYHHHRFVTYVQFKANNFTVRIPLKEHLKMSTQVSIGHTIAMSIAFLDQHGNPMIVDPKTDAAPVWTNSNPPVETVVAVLDGMSAVATPLTVGSDTISLNLVVGGVKFAATLDVNVIPEVQVLTSVAIVPVVS